MIDEKSYFMGVLITFIIMDIYIAILINLIYSLTLGIGFLFPLIIYYIYGGIKFNK